MPKNPVRTKYLVKQKTLSALSILGFVSIPLTGPIGFALGSGFGVVSVKTLLNRMNNGPSEEEKVYDLITESFEDKNTENFLEEGSNLVINKLNKSSSDFLSNVNEISIIKKEYSVFGKKLKEGYEIKII